VRVPLIVHGLTEGEVKGALAFLRGARPAAPRRTLAEAC
jgi:hypothetical protein